MVATLEKNYTCCSETNEAGGCTESITSDYKVALIECRCGLYWWLGVDSECIYCGYKPEDQMSKLVDYVCDICGKKIEDYPLGKKPPRCCRQVMRRLYAPVRIIYEGEGWTDAQREER